MGRPLKKSFFGPDSKVGKQLKVAGAYIDGAIVTSGVYIVKQKSTRKFIVTDGVETALCKLVDKSLGTIAEGEMVIYANSADQPAVNKTVRKLTARKIYTFAGEMFVWNELSNQQLLSQPAPVSAQKKGRAKAAPAANEAQIEQAAVGGDDANVTTDTVQALVQATATATLTGDVITSTTITLGGSGYSFAPDVTVTGDGTGAIITATITDGVVTALTIVDGGSGYSSATIVIDAPAT